MNVRWVRFGDVAELRRSAVEVDPTGMYRQIGVRGFGRGIFSYEPCLGKDLGKLRYFNLEPERLVISNIKGWEGAVATTGPQESGRIASNRFLTFRLDGADRDYLRHWFLSEHGLRDLGSASPGSADRNRTLAIKRLEEIKVPLPPLTDQRRIAAHLDGLEKGVESSGALTQLASKAQRGSLTSVLPRLFAAILDRAVPDRAIQVRIGDLCSSEQVVIHPGDPLRGADRFVGLEHIESHTGRRLGERPIGDESGRKLWFEPGHVLFGYLRPYLNKAWAADRTGLCSVEQFTLRPMDGVSPVVLSTVLRSAHVLNAVVEATNGLQLPRVGIKALMDVRVPDPRIMDSSAVLARVARLTDLVIAAESRRVRRDELLVGLLPATRNEIFNRLR